MCVRILEYVSAYYYICVRILLVCVRILLCMCPHTTMYVSACYYVCVRILLCMCPHAKLLHASTLCSMRTLLCVRILLCYADAYVFAGYYMRVRILLYSRIVACQQTASAL
jgi:hypothetical protein